MANDEDLARLRQGVGIWNAWRAKNPQRRVDLSQADLTGTDLTGANLSHVDLSEACLRRAVGANLSFANLVMADLIEANLCGADLRRAQLFGANLTKVNLRQASLVKAEVAAELVMADLVGADLRAADLTSANLRDADLYGANLTRTNLTLAKLVGANLTGANLQNATLIKTNLTGAVLRGCRVYGISAWDLKLDGAIQRDLEITALTRVDSLEVGQFLYLLLHNEKIRSVIDTITSKVVLILGRFTPERKVVLDALREELRKHDYLPVLCDFDKPESRDITETVSLLARMARFVVADITEARSIPQELSEIVPHLPSVPVQPLLQEGAGEYGMFEHFRRYPWMLKEHVYASPQQLIAELSERVIGPAEAKVRELRSLTSGSGASSPFP